MKVRYLLHLIQFLRRKCQYPDTEILIIPFIHIENIFSKPLITLKSILTPNFSTWERIFLSALTCILTAPLDKLILAVFTQYNIFYISNRIHWRIQSGHRIVLNLLKGNEIVFPALLLCQRIYYRIFLFHRIIRRRFILLRF